MLDLLTGLGQCGSNIGFVVMILWY